MDLICAVREGKYGDIVKILESGQYNLDFKVPHSLWENRYYGSSEWHSYIGYTALDMAKSKNYSSIINLLSKNIQMHDKKNMIVLSGPIDKTKAKELLGAKYSEAVFSKESDEDGCISMKKWAKNTAVY